MVNQSKLFGEHTDTKQCPGCLGAGEVPVDINGLVPEELRSEVFFAAWLRWKTFNRERRKALTPSRARGHLKELKQMGVEEAVRAIDRSINSGWTGLFPPSGKPKAAGSHYNAERQGMSYQEGGG